MLKVMKNYSLTKDGRKREGLPQRSRCHNEYNLALLS